VLAFWMFQVVFAATAATIVSGAMAERTKFSGYLMLQRRALRPDLPDFRQLGLGRAVQRRRLAGGLGFIDFAGSTVVHSVGGWAALAGAIVLGPRLGKYAKDGSIRPILGHNMPLAALGVFILWLGWFGFNPGSTTAANKDIAMIFVNTNLAAATGACLRHVHLLDQVRQAGSRHEPERRPGRSGGHHRPCANVSPTSSVVIGAVAGVPGGFLGAVLRPHQNRRPRRRDLGPRRQRRLGHPGGRSLQRRGHLGRPSSAFSCWASRPALSGRLPPPSPCSS
jgi:ammonium transporter, Amt family